MHHDKFKNDSQIAISTKSLAHEVKISTGLNPEIDSRLKFIISKSLFDMLFRIMPRVLILTRVFDKKIQAAAVRFYLERTLNKTISVGALRRKIQFDLDSEYLDKKTNSATRQKLRKILKDGVKPSERIL